MSTASPTSSLPGPRRIHVVGVTGSGKTTLARALAQRYGIPHIELDALYWGPNWTPVPQELFSERVQHAVSQPEWVVEGNYHSVRDYMWSRAMHLVWLDYPLALVLWRLLKRTIPRIISKEMLWGTNQERFTTAFMSKDSLFVWALQTHARRRREYPALLAQPEYRHLQVTRLTSPRATAAWLASLTRENGQT